MVIRSGGYILTNNHVAGAVAFLVYEFVGVRIVRRGWFNLDRLWAYALGLGAALTLIVA